MGRLLTPEERLKLRKELSNFLGYMPEDQEGLREDDVEEWKQYWLGKRRSDEGPVVRPKATEKKAFSPFAALATADDRPLTRHERFRLRMQVWDLKEGPGPKRGPCPPDEPTLRISTVQAYVQRSTGNPRAFVEMGRILEA